MTVSSGEFVTNNILEMFVTLSIVDPSRYTSTFSLNVFADPGFVGYLPNPSSGHVIILREVKVGNELSKAVSQIMLTTLLVSVDYILQ